MTTAVPAPAWAAISSPGAGGLNGWTVHELPASRIVAAQNAAPGNFTDLTPLAWSATAPDGSTTALLVVLGKSLIALGHAEAWDLRVALDDLLDTISDAEWNEP